MFHMKHFSSQSPQNCVKEGQMASKRRSGGRKRRRGAAKVAAAALLCILLFLGYMYVQSRIVFVRYATVSMRDLPPAFDGMTILFASDIDVKGEGEARAAAKLFDRLALLEPDMLLLGGDYAGASLFSRLNGDETDADLVPARHAFLTSLKDFPAPLGKYAVAAADDMLPEQLRGSMDAAGIRLLLDDSAEIHRGDAGVSVVGLLPGSAKTASLAGRFSGGDCVIALMHSPAEFARAVTSDARDGGAWADLMLAGRTHGGQMVVAGRTLLTLTEHERRCLAGWRKEEDAFLLTTQGVGCEAIDLRLNTEAEVHLITLKRAEA
jgi:predicted MPP superfamily phosphohydrolase